MRQRLRVLGACLAVLSISLTAATLFSPHELAAESEPVLDADASLLQEAASYAGDFDVSVDEAVKRLIAQSDDSALFDAASSLSPATFAGAWTEHAPVFRSVIAYKGQPPTDADLSEIKSLVSHRVDVAEAEFSLAELVEAQARVDAYRIVSLPDSTSEVDVPGNSLLVTAPVALNENTLAELQRASIVPLRLEIAPLAADLHTWGGRRLTNPDIQGAACTTGFTVRHTQSGQRGVSTAGHCVDPLRYYQSSTINYPMTTFDEVRDDDQDIQFLRQTSGTIHPVEPKFWNGSLYANVNSIVAVQNMLGDYVCHFGATTASSCGRISSTTFDPGNQCGPTSNGDCHSSWIKVVSAEIPNNLKCDFGDSGGVVFAGSSAYGILKGGLTTGPNPGDCTLWYFMQTGFFDFGPSNLAILTN